MIRKTVCLAVLIMLLGLTTNAFAAPWALWQGSVSDDYSDPANWVDGQGNPLGHMANSTSDTCTGIGRSFGGTYWPVLYDNPLVGWGPFSAHTNLFAMTEYTESVNSQLTFDGGFMYFQPNQYWIIARRTGDVATVIIDEGGVGAYYETWGSNPAAGNEPIWGMTRWLRVGRGDSTGGGLGTLIMNGGVVYAQAVSVGSADGTGDAGSSVTINDGAEMYVGVNFYEASFDVGPTASMTINPGGYVKMFGDRLKGDVNEQNEYVWAKGALNIVADASASGRLIVPAWIETVAQLKDYFGYDDGGTLVPGNINAVYDGGAGQFVFSYPGGNFTEITVIPEPATIALLGIGGLCLLRRKRS